MEYLIQLDNVESLDVAKKLWSSPKMQDFLVNKYDFFKTKDGLIIELEKVNKITIDKTMYYDDEYEPPKVNEENFIYYNRSNAPGRNLEDYLEEKERLNTQGCATGQYDYQGIYFRVSYSDYENVVHCDWHDDKDKYFKRYLTKEEESEYIKLMQERREQYIERLKKYFKRYKDKIHTYGYYANR